MHSSPEVLALLALGEDAGTTAEREHVTTCPVCSQEVAELASIADVGRSTTAADSLTTPSPEVWDRIRAELGFQPAGSVATLARGDGSSSTASVTDLSSRREAVGNQTGGTSAARRFLALAVAAALALIVGVAAGIGYERSIIGPTNRVIARAQLKPLPQWAGATGTAEVTADGRGGRTLKLTMSSPKPIDGVTQVWLIDPKTKHPVSMGILKNGVADLPIPRGMSLFEQPVVDVSDEPPNDSNPAHSGNSILRGELI